MSSTAEEDARPAKRLKGEGEVSKKETLGATWGIAKEGRVPRPKPGESVKAMMTYQGDLVPRGITGSGKVKTHRDGSGTDDGYIGCDFVPREVLVTNARGQDFNTDKNGFQLVDDPLAWDKGLNLFEDEKILKDYYPKCVELVKRITGASKVFAFDHNVRSQSLSQSRKKVQGGNEVQGPALLVHADYSVTSAPRRVRDLAKPPKVNDTFRKILGDQPLIDPNSVEKLLRGRWMIMNVWRNIRETPVQQFPLAMCDGPSVPFKDVVTFEIHYADRVGENYFAGKTSDHKWYYYPEMSRDEAILLKTWDSAGKDFAGNGVFTVPSTFCFHTAFEDPSTPENPDDRTSIEVRTVAFFDDAPEL